MAADIFDVQPEDNDGPMAHRLHRGASRDRHQRRRAPLPDPGGRAPDGERGEILITDDQREVAKNGLDAMMNGEGGVISSWQIS